MNKLTFLALFLTLFVCQLFAQAPKGFNYQAVVRNNSGQIMANRTIGFQITIHQGSESGTVVYTYSGQTQTNNNGTITLHIGENSAEYDAIDWGNGPYFLHSEIDPMGNTNYTLSTTQQILSVPYAQYATHAKIADSISSSFSCTENDPLFSRWGYLYDSLVNAPSRLSDFTNDLNLSDFNNDLSLSDFTNNLNLSDFNNDLNFYQNGDTLFLGDNSVVLNFPSIDTIHWSDIVDHPTNLSDFTNDLNFYQNGDTLFLGNNSLILNITGIDTLHWSDIIDHPTNLSQFNNDLSLSEFNNDLNFYQNGDTIFLGNNSLILDINNIDTIHWNDIVDHPSNLSEFNNDLNLSDFNNDLNFYQSGDTIFMGNNSLVLNLTGIDTIDWNDIVNHPTSLSQFINDLNLSEFNNDIPFSISGDTIYFGDSAFAIPHQSITSIDWNNINNRPFNLSDLNNDLNLSDFPNDAGFLSSESQGLSDVLAINNNASLGITGLPSPTGNGDAVNKFYADSVAMALAAQMNALLNSRLDSLQHVVDSLNHLVNPQGVNLDSILNLVDSLAHPQVQGSKSFLFSVSENKRVQFSKGNLQYNPFMQLFRFAENQYDYSGEINNQISDNVNQWLDLFGYGTSGWKGGRQRYYPYETNTDNINYMFNTTTGDDLSGMYINADWGVYNPIINGGNQMGLWRTLNYDEWSYIINGRENAANLKTLATVCTKKGLIILPDNWSTSGVSIANPSLSNYNTNVYNESQWQILENAGAIFLPAAGCRNGSSTENDGNNGYYWSSTHANSAQSRTLKIDVTDGATMSETNCSRGCSVRLVRDF